MITDIGDASPEPARFVLAEDAPSDQPSPVQVALRQSVAAWLDARGYSATGVPPRVLPRQAEYAAAAALKADVDGLFMALPAVIRVEFSNSPSVFLAGLRERAVRDALAEQGLMRFYGEEPPGDPPPAFPSAAERAARRLIGAVPVIPPAPGDHRHGET